MQPVFDSHHADNTENVVRVRRRTLSCAEMYDMRMEYSSIGIEDADVEKDPIVFFEKWLGEAVSARCIEPNAMCVSTCRDNRPSSRFVLLKGVDHRGFFFCTNYKSRKGREIETNPHGALNFWWGELERQVRVEGNIFNNGNQNYTNLPCMVGEITMTSSTDSDEYFAVRPRGNQIGSWSSDQSAPIESRDMLEVQEISMMNR
jgi:pyridoxamine 5'-phosphate oxidase